MIRVKSFDLKKGVELFNAFNDEARIRIGSRRGLPTGHRPATAMPRHRPNKPPCHLVARPTRVCKVAGTAQ